MFKVETKKKPKMWQVRKNLARFLVWLARKVDPQSEYSYGYYMEQTLKAHIDQMNYGTGVIKISHVPYHEVVKSDADE